MGEPLIRTGAGPGERVDVTAPAEPQPEIFRAAIWLGIEPCRPQRPGAAVPPVVAEQISAFIDEHYPGAQVDAGAPASFCVRCAGSLTEVMHIADELGWHARCLSGSEDRAAFDARMGVVIAADGESVASLVHRAEDAAESLAL